jgi:hypothetical protein
MSDHPPQSKTKIRRASAKEDHEGGSNDINTSDHQSSYSMSNDANNNNHDMTEDEGGSVYFWKELYSVISSFGLVFLSYLILVYLTSYSTSECPPTAR